LDLYIYVGSFIKKAHFNFTIVISIFETCMYINRINSGNQGRDIYENADFVSLACILSSADTEKTPSIFDRRQEVSNADNWRLCNESLHERMQITSTWGNIKKLTLILVRIQMFEMAFLQCEFKLESY